MRNESSKTHRIAGLKISRVTPSAVAADPLADFWEPKDALPDLEPAETKLNRLRRQIFPSDTITVSHSSAMDDLFDPETRAENSNFTSLRTISVLLDAHVEGGSSQGQAARNGAQNMLSQPHKTYAEAILQGSK